MLSVNLNSICQDENTVIFTFDTPDEAKLFMDEFLLEMELEDELAEYDTETDTEPAPAKDGVERTLSRGK